jgi:hypothetical protein
MTGRRPDVSLGGPRIPKMGVPKRPGGTDLNTKTLKHFLSVVAAALGFVYRIDAPANRSAGEFYCQQVAVTIDIKYRGLVKLRSMCASTNS